MAQARPTPARDGVLPGSHRRGHRLVLHQPGGEQLLSPLSVSSADRVLLPRLRIASGVSPDAARTLCRRIRPQPPVGALRPVSGICRYAVHAEGRGPHTPACHTYLPQNDPAPASPDPGLLGRAKHPGQSILVAGSLTFALTRLIVRDITMVSLYYPSGHNLMAAQRRWFWSSYYYFSSPMRCRCSMS